MVSFCFLMEMRHVPVLFNAVIHGFSFLASLRVCRLYSLTILCLAVLGWLRMLLSCLTSRLSGKCYLFIQLLFLSS